MRRTKRPIWRHGINLPPLLHDVAAERIDGNWPIHVHGDNQTMVAATWETIYPPSNLYTWPGAAALLDILSDNANDDGAPAGIGARTVYIWGLNGSFRPISETVTLNGVTAVQTTLEYLRVQGIRVVSFGASGWNVGNISVQDLANTYTLCYMVAGMGRQNGAIYTVPEGKTLYITEWHVGEASSQRTEFVINAREPGAGFKSYCGLFVRNQIYGNRFDCPKRFDEKTDIQILGQTTGQSAGDSCACFQGWVEPSEGNIAQDR